MRSYGLYGVVVCKPVSLLPKALAICTFINERVTSLQALIGSLHPSEATKCVALNSKTLDRRAKVDVHRQQTWSRDGHQLTLPSLDF